MKRLTTTLLAVLLLTALLAGCGKKTDSGAPAENLTGSLTDVVDKIYAEKDPGLMLGKVDVDLKDANALKAYTGLSDATKVKEAVASEAMIGSQAYSLVLVRVNDKADAQTVAKDMLEGINPAKWICVQADDVKAAVRDDVVMLVMVQSDLDIAADDLVKAFKTVCGGSLDAELSK